MKGAGILLAALLLDLLIGDPEQLTRSHPVVLMGKAICLLEKVLRKRFPTDSAGQLRAGIALAVLVPVGTLTGSLWILSVLQKICMPAAVILEILWCWRCLAVKNLRDEALRVYSCLRTGSLSAARKAVGRIVGRDTEHLSEDGVIRATVETVAENFSDGVVAPMIYMALGGAPLALFYKAINTMDSMVGYKNERYLYFGRTAAKLDDAANFVPSRFAALLLIMSAGLSGENTKGAMRIWRRDRRKHASPNSAQCEAAAAGALGIRLGGPARYFGQIYEKAYIGDAERPVGKADIRRICRMERTGSILCAGMLCLLRILVSAVV